jgi:hypothetical protein
VNAMKKQEPMEKFLLFLLDVKQFYGRQGDG